MDERDVGHPIDAAVDRIVQHKAARRMIISFQEQVLAALGKNENGRKALLALEELRNEMADEREQAYFNLGYENGAAGERARDRRGSEKELALATEFRDRIVQARLPPRQAALGLLECLWAVVAGGDEKLAKREANGDVTRARARRSRRP